MGNSQGMMYACNPALLFLIIKSYLIKHGMTFIVK